MHKALSCCLVAVSAILLAPADALALVDLTDSGKIPVRVLVAAETESARTTFLSSVRREIRKFDDVELVSDDERNCLTLHVSLIEVEDRAGNVIGYALSFAVMDPAVVIPEWVIEKGGFSDSEKLQLRLLQKMQEPAGSLKDLRISLGSDLDELTKRVVAAFDLEAIESYRWLLED